jgi:hypothetical protein
MTPVISINNYKYEPIDLCACYEPIFFPSDAQVKEWERLRTERNNPSAARWSEESGTHGISSKPCATAMRRWQIWPSVLFFRDRRRFVHDNATKLW